MIDNIFYNSLEYHSFSGNLLYELSDHLTQFLILEGFVKERSLPETLMYKKDFDKFNEREFEEIVINGLDWEEICMIRIGSSSASFKSFHDTLNFHIEEMVPSKEVTLKHGMDPPPTYLGGGYRQMTSYIFRGLKILGKSGGTPLLWGDLHKCCNRWGLICKPG